MTTTTVTMSPARRRALPAHDRVLPAPGFGAQLRAWRRAAGLSQGALAARAGVNNTYVSHLERGDPRCHPSADVLAKMAAALSVDTRTMLNAAGRLERRPLRALVRQSPAATELLRYLATHPLPDATYRELAEMARAAAAAATGEEG